MRNKIILGLTFLFFLGILYSQEPEKFGVDQTDSKLPVGAAIGSNAPNFSGLSQFNKPVDLHKLLKNNKVVVFFYRGNWCPYCNSYLKDLKDSLQYIKDLDAVVIAVTPESHKNVLKSAGKTDPNLLILSDNSYSIMNNYDVLFKVTAGYQLKIKTMLFTDIAKHNNQEEAFLPVPATFIIDQNKKIIYKHFDINYKQRAPIQNILTTLSKNSQQKTSNTGFSP